MAEKTDFRTMYDRDYIGSFDLPLGAGDLTLTIKKVTGGELTAIGGRKSKKPIVHFNGEGVKPLICNKTNGRTIASLYGNYVEAWAGKKITLFRSTTRNPDGGGDTDCIRVRPKVPDGFAGEAEPVVTAEQAKELAELCVKKGVDPKAFLSAGAIADFTELPARLFTNATKWIDKQVAEKAKQL